MSTLGGIYKFDGKPIDEGLLLAIGEALASHSPDGGSQYRSGSIGMVYRAFHTDKESRYEIQPLVSAKGHLLCWDGRLDNGYELIPVLRDDFLDSYTDAGIALAAYRKWGDEFLSKLIGDFALSLWDPGTLVLLLARDPAGPRPLFYHANTDRIVWSSELSTLLNWAGVTAEVNDDYVAGYLSLGAAPELTPYKDIYAVPPGSVVVVRNGHIQVHRFWGPDPKHEIRYKTDEGYEEHFRHLFREAVRCRLRADGPVWVTLSGGLDSSAIACMADEILESGEAAAPRIETVSYVYDESSDSDEREFISSVEAKRGRTGHHLLESEYPLLSSFPDETQVSFPDGMDCFLDRHRSLCEAMRHDDARVLLAGFGGDEMLYSASKPSPELGDCLVRWRLFRLHRALLTWSTTLKEPYIKLLWRRGILPLMSRRIQANHLDSDLLVASWYDKKFVAKMNLRERYLAPPDIFSLKMPSKRDQATGFLSAMQAVSRTSYRSRGLIEVTHPYLHRPLVEFLHAIPFDQKLRPGETRSLMRRALRGVLPEKILNRKGKKGTEEPFLRAIAREWPRLRPMFENAQVCSRGYMNADDLHAALERARNGCEKNRFALIRTITLEFWLRALQSRGSSSRSTATAGESVAPFSAAHMTVEPARRDATASRSLP